MYDQSRHLAKNNRIVYSEGRTQRRHFCFCRPSLILASFMVFLLFGCSSQQQRQVSRSNFFFDTVITITLYGTQDEKPIQDCFALAQKYEKLFSSTVKGSDVWSVNHSGGKPVVVDPETISLLQTGIKYGKLSGGRLDITIGKLSELWNFSEIAESSDNDDNETNASAIPSEAKINALLPHIDYQNIRIEHNTVCLKDPQAAIDLGGIAKGYIADRMKELLRKSGVTSGIINLGGNVLTIGEKPDGSDYRVGVQKPFGDSGEVLGTLRVKDKSVVTSGIYERYFRVKGKLYHHLLDVKSGYPYNNGLSEVTIISSDSVDGDALSTACFALGLQEGMALIKSLPEVEAVFVDEDLAIHCSPGAKALYKDLR